MAQHSDVTVYINVDRVIGRLGFGIPLILEGLATTAHAYTEYTKLRDIIDDFGEDGAITDVARIIFAQEDPPRKIACAAVTTAVATALPELSTLGWRQLLVVSEGAEGETPKADIASWCEDNGKMYFMNVSTVGEITAIEDRTSLDHCIAFYSTDTACDHPAATLVGAVAGKAVGSLTYKNQLLSGIVPENMTTAELTTLHNAGGITALQKAGDIVSSEGQTLSKKYADLIDSKDWLIQQIEYNVQKVLNNENKVPYDNTGVDLLDSTVVSVLKEAFNNGMIAVDEDGAPSYWTDFARREETVAADREARKYIGGQFGFILAGAIHTAEITGVIEI